MKLLRLHGMHRAFTQSLEPDSQKYTPDELIEFLIQSEPDDRYNRRINRLTSNAKFRYTASIEDIQYDESRNIDKNVIQRLAECLFIKEAKNIIVTGSTGVGKSY
jgi:DNA replication protein DnaC